MTSRKRIGGLVLCGGRSTRMGVAKEWMKIGEETLLQRTVRTVSQAVPVVGIAARAGQALPMIPDGVRIATDRAEGAGPLMGLFVGLEALARDHVDAAFVTGCDHPGLRASFVRRMIERLDDAAEVVAVDYDGRTQPLPAVYRTSLLPRLALAVERREHSLRSFLKEFNVRVLQSNDFADSDPALESMVNVNDPQAWNRWLKDRTE